jgi:hypothetical protein
MLALRNARRGITHCSRYAGFNLLSRKKRGNATPHCPVTGDGKKGEAGIAIIP